MTAHSSILAWKIPRTEETSGPQSPTPLSSQEHTYTSFIYRKQIPYVLDGCISYFLNQLSIGAEIYQPDCPMPMLGNKKYWVIKWIYSILCWYLGCILSGNISLLSFLTVNKVVLWKKSLVVSWLIFTSIYWLLSGITIIQLFKSLSLSKRKSLFWSQFLEVMSLSPSLLLFSPLSAPQPYQGFLKF